MSFAQHSCKALNLDVLAIEAFLQDSDRPQQGTTFYLGRCSTVNFKHRDAQNQRIEMITENHLVIGIDVAKEIQVADALSY